MGYNPRKSIGSSNGPLAALDWLGHASPFRRPSQWGLMPVGVSVADVAAMGTPAGTLLDLVLFEI
ncbi:hypothetical protein CRG98_050423 [Punica granatum]|uniref:Uncharacterized protein n=1 Tax=Punica granatum TaxID=22663 RepID=A0A2I0GCD5_PUNGR|nr:hypothetical protein CRG98_050423 [Punica granatum]